jgi:hypothetical protein
VKKGLFVVMIVGLAMTFTAPAMAIDWSASGFISWSFNAMRNVGAGSSPDILLANADGLDDMGSFQSMRSRLKITAAASEDLYGVFYFEMDSDRFGETTGGRNHIGVWGADQVAVEVKNLYIDFRVPLKLPVWMRVGVQDYKIRPHIFLAADAAGVTGRIKIDPINLTINLMYAKVRDPDDSEAVSGAELYAVDVSLPIGPVTPGMFFTYENVRFEGPDPDDEALWWIGAYLDGKIGPFRPRLDFIYSGGTEHNRSRFAADRDYESWLVRTVLSYLWNNFEFGVGGMYVKGEDADTNDYEQFQLPRNGSEAASSTNMADFVVFWGGWMDTGCGGPRDIHLLGAYRTNYPGFWDVRGFIYYQLFDWLKLGAQVAYIGDTEDGQDIIDAASGLAGDNDDDDSIGWEFDIGANVKLYKNLSWNTAFGYLVAHKGLSLVGGVKPDDPWVLRSCLYFIF